MTVAARRRQILDESAALARTRAAVTGVVERYQEAGLLGGDASADEVARVVTAIAGGFVLQRGVLGDADAATFRAGIATLVAPAQRTT